MLKADGFDDAIIGVAVRCSQPDLVAYSWERCVEILVAKGCSYEEAAEYMDFNVTGAWVGPETPVFVHAATLEEIVEWGD